MCTQADAQQLLYVLAACLVGLANSLSLGAAVLLRWLVSAAVFAVPCAVAHFRPAWCVLQHLQPQACELAGRLPGALLTACATPLECLQLAALHSESPVFLCKGSARCLSIPQRLPSEQRALYMCCMTYIETHLPKPFTTSTPLALAPSALALILLAGSDSVSGPAAGTSVTGRRCCAAAWQRAWRLRRCARGSSRRRRPGCNTHCCRPGSWPPPRWPPR